MVKSQKEYNDSKTNFRQEFTKIDENQVQG